MFQDQKYSECTQKQESFNLKKSASYKVVIVTKQTVHGNLIINVMLFPLFPFVAVTVNSIAISIERL